MYSPLNVSIGEAPRTTSHPNVSPPPVLYSVPKADTFIWQQSQSTPFAVGRSRATFTAKFLTASSSVEGMRPVCHVSACSALKLTFESSFIPSSNVLNFFANFISTSPFINFYEWGGFIRVPFDINPIFILLKYDNVFVEDEIGRAHVCISCRVALYRWAGICIPCPSTVVEVVVPPVVI